MKFQIKKTLATISMLLFGLLSASPALASTLVLSPSSGTFNRNCNFSLDIILDTAGVATDGTDAIVFFDASKFTATNIDTQSKVYPDYPGNNIDNSAGKIMVSGLASPTAGFTGSGKLATIAFIVKDSASTGATQMTFDFDPNNKMKTTDSNVVQKGTATETLNAVTNGNYTVGAGNCAAASPSPASTATIINQGGGFVGSPGGATPSANFIPLKTLPQGGTQEVTATIAIMGVVLTVLGILGLALL